MNVKSYLKHLQKKRQQTHTFLVLFPFVLVCFVLFFSFSLLSFERLFSNDTVALGPVTKFSALFLLLISLHVFSLFESFSDLSFLSFKRMMRNDHQFEMWVKRK